MIKAYYAKVWDSARPLPSFFFRILSDKNNSYNYANKLRTILQTALLELYAVIPCQISILSRLTFSPGISIGNARNVRKEIA